MQRRQLIHKVANVRVLLRWIIEKNGKAARLSGRRQIGGRQYDFRVARRFLGSKNCRSGVYGEALRLFD